MRIDADRWNGGAEGKKGGLGGERRGCYIIFNAYDACWVELLGEFVTLYVFSLYWHEFCNDYLNCFYGS